MKTTTKASARETTLASKVVKTADFSNRDLYVGIDVHKKRWQVAVLCNGVSLGNISIEASVDILVKHLRGRYGDAQFTWVYKAELLQ
jgi:transposase